MNTKFYFSSRAILLIIFMQLLQTKSFCQEMISNGGFEWYTLLPVDFSDWDKCINWDNCGGVGSPDYIHMSGSGPANMPYTYWGTIYPQEGNAAMGFKTFKSYYSGFREYITTQFITPMVPGETYTIKFWLTNCQADWAYGAGSDHVGIRFSQNILHQTGDDPILLTPQLEIPGIVFNTAWQQYTFSFTADSAYHYITFGNFYSDAATSYMNFEISDNPGGVEYFIDGISVLPIVPINYVNAEICAGETYTFPDGTTADSTCVDSSWLTTAFGADSLIITTLTAHPAYFHSASAHICSGSSYLLPDGSYATAAGIYTSHLFTVAGCDSIIETEIFTDSVFSTNISANTCFGEPYILPDGAAAITAGTYSSHLFTAAGCDSLITTTLSVFPENMTTISAAICDGENYTLPDGSIATVAGLYIHIFTAANGCDSVIHTHLTVNPSYHFTNMVSLCSGETYTLPDGTITAVSGMHNFNYSTTLGCDSNFTIYINVFDTTWNEINAEICAGDHYLLPNGTTVNISGNYISHLFTVHGCDSTIVTHLTVHDAVDITMAVPGSICFESAAVELIALPEGGIFSGEGISGDYFDPAVTPGAGNYPVTYSVTDNYGCMYASTENIEVLQNFANAGSDISIAYGESILINSISGGDYSWSPPTGLSCVDCATPIANPVITTNYTLTSVDANGCVASDNMTVNVDMSTVDDIFIPNTFTPNGDGINDYFIPLGAGIMEITSFQIFDRWGACIYKEENIPVNDPQSGWDGTINGIPANSGVYAYMIELRYVSNIPTKKYGNVTLVR